MRKILLVILAMTFAAGTAYAQGCGGGSCDAVKVSGYMAPNFRMVDRGEAQISENNELVTKDNYANMGFGMAFLRFTFSGAVEGGSIVKKIAWRIETDISQPGRQALQWAYVQPIFSDQFSMRLGYVKMPFSREILHATGKLLTVDRLVGSEIGALGYGDYAYGFEGHFKHELIKAQFGVYDGEGNNMSVRNQDKVFTLGARAVFTPPVDGLEFGGNLVMKGLNGVHNGTAWEVCLDDGTYLDHEDYTQSTTALAFGADADYRRKIGDEMYFWGQAEFGIGDNWMAGPKLDDLGVPTEEDFQDWEWYSFQYFYLKALLKVTKDFGFAVGFSQWDPNTDSDVGKNDEETKITPGIVYWWAKHFRTQVEVQLITEGGGMTTNSSGNLVEADDLTFTHFVVQNVWLWP